MFFPGKKKILSQKNHKISIFLSNSTTSLSKPPTDSPTMTFPPKNRKRERKNKIKPTLSNFHTIPHSFLHLKLRSFFTLSLILYDDVSKRPLPTPLTTTTTAHHYRFRRPSDHASEPNSSNPDSYPHCLKSRTTGNLFSLPLKPSPPQMHEAEHDDTDDVVQKPWNLRPRKPTHLPKAALEIGTGPSRNHQQVIY